MAKNKKDYWTERQKKLNEQQDKDEKALSKRLEKYYDKESRKLEKEIARYYEEYGEDNVIEYRRLLEQLPEEDVRLLYEKMDDFAVKYPEYAHLMPVRESIYKLNRLEGLKTSVDMQMLENGAYLNKEVEKHLNKTALRNMMDASKILGNSFNFEDENVIRTFVGKAWTGGTNFSEKIWGNTKKLAEYINKDLAQGFARGTNYEKMVKQIRERYTNVSRKDAMRLVYTEGTYVMNEARAQVFGKDFEEYEIIPIEDRHTCQICMDMIGKHFRYEDREPGTNYPPFHPWCRCIAAPYTPEWDEEDAFYNKNEQEQSKKRPEMERYALKEGLLKDEDYFKLFEKLGENDNTTRNIKNVAKEILEHRDGTDKEDLAFIDTKTRWYKINKGATKPKKCKPTEAMLKRLEENDDYTIISIHNHPGGSLPSVSDLSLSQKRKYKYGLTIGHNGNIYKYSTSEEYKAFDKNYEKQVDTYLNMLENKIQKQDYESKRKAEMYLEELRKLGINIEVISV